MLLLGNVLGFTERRDRTISRQNGSVATVAHTASLAAVRRLALDRGGDCFALGLYVLPYGLGRLILAARVEVNFEQLILFFWFEAFFTGFVDTACVTVTRYLHAH